MRVATLVHAVCSVFFVAWATLASCAVTPTPICVTDMRSLTPLSCRVVSSTNCNFTLSLPLTATPGLHNVTILSDSLGTDSNMVSGTSGKLKGIVGPVLVGGVVITNNTCVGLLQVASPLCVLSRLTTCC